MALATVEHRITSTDEGPYLNGTERCLSLASGMDSAEPTDETRRRKKEENSNMLHRL